MKTFLILFVALFSVSLMAQDYDASSIEVSKSDVEHFIKNYPAIEKEFENYDATEFDYKPESGGDIQSFITALEGHEEANKIVRKYGYTDLPDWAMKTWTIAMTYVSLKMEGEAMPAMQEAIKQIENDESMTPEQKEAALAQMKSVMGAMETAYAPSTNPKNVAAVKPYVNQLDALFDGDDD